MLEKSEKLVLQAFIGMKIPDDFRHGDVSQLCDYVIGYAHQLFSRGRIVRPEWDCRDGFSFDDETKKSIDTIVDNNPENILYYNLMKSCLILFEKYKK